MSGAPDSFSCRPRSLLLTMQTHKHVLKTQIALSGLLLCLAALLALSIRDNPSGVKIDCGDSHAITPKVVAPPEGCAWVVFGHNTVIAEVAATVDKRASGLMYRDEVPDGTGMLFVYQDTLPRSFWMSNTYVALDIAYMDPSYRVVDIVSMEPEVTTQYPSAAPAMFGLEVRRGWFAEKGIEVGDQAKIIFGD